MPDADDLAQANVVLLRGYENELARKVKRRLARMRDDLLKVTRVVDTTNPARVAREKALLKVERAAQGITRKAYADIDSFVSEDLAQLARANADASGQLLANMPRVGIGDVTLLSQQRIRSIVRFSPVEGRVMGAWWKQQSLSTTERFAGEMRKGWISGEDTGALVRRVRGARVQGGFAGGIMSVSSRSAVRLVRTATNQVANEATLATYAANKRLVPEFMFIATLDDRTTVICISNDGRVFKVDDAGAPRPPLHWQCRSTVVPKMADNLGIAPIKRRSVGQWLKTQSTAKQNRILGTARAEAWRSGQISLHDMVRDNTHVLSLEELRGKYGLEPKVPRVRAKVPRGPRLKKGAELRAWVEEKRVELIRQKTLVAKETSRLSRAWEVPHKKLFQTLGRGVAESSDEVQALLAERKLISDQLTAVRLRGEGLSQQFKREVYEGMHGGKVGKGFKLSSTSVRGLDAERRAVWRARSAEVVDDYNRILGPKWAAHLESVGAPPVLKVSKRRLRAWYENHADWHASSKRFKERKFTRGKVSLVQLENASGNKTLIHELGHHFEYRSTKVHQRALEFRTRRTTGESIRSLRELLPGQGYAHNELTYADKFKHPYTGKVYASASAGEYASEIISMGMEYFYDNPFQFARSDPDFFDFITGLLQEGP